MAFGTSAMTDAAPPSGRMLDTAPPAPPPNRKSIMAMASDTSSGGGIDMSAPEMKAAVAMGKVRSSLMELSAALPPLAPALQQIIAGLQSVVPQMLADIVAGNPPGSSGAGMGAPPQGGAVSPPPVSTGMP